jgi:hypothetical protein
MTLNIKRAFIQLIERFDSPLAPIQVQSTYAAIQSLGPTLAGNANEAETQALAERLMKDFSDEEMERISGSPELVLALMGVLQQSLVDLTRPLQ